MTVQEFFDGFEMASASLTKTQLADHLIDQFFSDHLGQLKRARA